MTLLSNSTTTHCGDSRSQKGGSHGEDRCSRGQTARGLADAETSTGRNGGVDGHRHLAVEGRVLPAVGWQRTTTAEYALGHRACSSGGGTLPWLSAARGVRGVRIRVRAGVVAAGVRGGGERDCAEPGGTGAGVAGENRSRGRRQAGAQ